MASFDLCSRCHSAWLFMLLYRKNNSSDLANKSILTNNAFQKLPYGWIVAWCRIINITCKLESSLLCNLWVCLSVFHFLTISFFGIKTNKVLHYKLHNDPWRKQVRHNKKFGLPNQCVVNTNWRVKAVNYKVKVKFL